jgi:hypothetical protein
MGLPLNNNFDRRALPLVLAMSAIVAPAERVGLLPEITAEHGEIVIGGLYQSHIEYTANSSRPRSLFATLQGRGPCKLSD